MRRVQSGRILRPKQQQQELQDIQLLNEANRKLRQLQVIEALSLFREYIERMKQKHGLDSPLFDFKAIIMIVCQFALDLQTQTGKHDLPITMLLWAEDQCNNTFMKKEVMQFLADAYRKAGQNNSQVSQSQVQLNQKFKIVKPIIKNKSETGLKTFYFRNNNNNKSNLLLSNSQKDTIDQQKQQKQFVIKKLNQPPQKEIDWSSSDEENKQAPPQSEHIEPIIENNQRELRLQFLYSQLSDKLEWRNIVVQKKEEEKSQINLIPLKSIIKIQSAFRRKIQMRRYKKLQREALRKKRQENYEESIKAIQRWVRFIMRTSRFRNAAYELLKIKRLTRYPLREFFAAIKIQKFVKKFQMKKQKLKPKNLIWRRKTFEYQFDFVSQAIFNRTFYLTVKNDQKSIIFTIQPYFKKKCDRKLLKKKVVEILIEQFNYVLARLPEYIDSLESEIEPNLQVLQAIKLLEKSVSKFINPITKSFKLSIPAVNFYRNLYYIPFEDLIYFDDFNMLQIHGFHDFQYTDMYVVDKQNTQNTLQNIQQLPGQERIITIIQSIFKAKRAVQQMKQKINRKRDIYKSFYVGNKELYAQVFITFERTIYARWITQRKWQKTNILSLSNLVNKQIGYPCRENFFEIYQIKDDNRLVYTEEAQFWAQKEVELKVKKKKLNFYQISSFAQRIQRAAKRYLAEKDLIIKRGIAKHQKEMSKSLVRKVVLSGDPVRAYFMNFQLITDSENKQSISIDVKALEHIYSNEYVHPYTQPLFYEIELSELTKIAQKMVELGEVKNMKGQTRFDVCNLMEVQGKLMDEQDEQSQEKKESTLGARKILNHYMRKKWEQKLLIDIPVQKVEKQKKLKQQKEQKKEDNIFEHIIIFYRYKEYRKQQILHLIDEKQVIPYDQDSISDFIRKFKPVSNYCYGQQLEEGKYNVNFLDEMKQEQENKIQREKEQKEKQEQEEKQRKIDELERQRLLRESLYFIFHDYCVISGQRLSIRIVYHKTLKQLIIKSISEEGQQNELNVNINQILPIEFKIEFLKMSIDMLVLKQLIVKDEELLFIQDSHQQEMLQLEYVQWEQSQYKIIDYSNLVGNVYGLESIFAKLNKSKTTLQNLINCGKQVFLITTLNMKDQSQEYVMNLSDNQLILTIYLEENSNDFKIIIIPIQEFKCVYLMNTVLHKPPNNIIKLLLPTIYALNKLIEIDQNNICNFQQIRPFLYLIFQEQFTIKIQQRLKIRQQEIHYKMLRKREITQIYLQTRYINSESRYVKIIFFLMAYKIKIVFLKLNDIDQSGQIINQKEKQIYYIDLLKCNFKQEQFRINPDKWVDIQSIRLPEYYQKTYKPLVDYIMESLKIEYPFRINFNQDLQAWQQVNKKRKFKSETVFFNIIEAVIKLQVHYKTYKQQERYLFKKLNYQNNQSKSRQLGKLCYRTYRNFKEIMYLVNIYIQNGVDDQITVDLIDTTDKYNKNKQYRGIYIKDPTTMLNLGQGVFYEFLLNLIYLEDGLLKFKSEEFQQLTQDKTENQLTLQIEQPGKIELINHIQKHQDANIADTIYNVVHSGQSQINFNENQNNTVQVSVNLSDLKKLYPSLHTQDQSVMKMVSDQIIDGIKVSRLGIVQVDQQRINPSFIKIQQSKIDIQEPNGKRPQSKIITLSKKTSYYLKEKFLLVVNLIERKVAKIIEEDKDSVYSHYEELFQILATSLTVQNKEPMEWELSILQGEQLTHQKSQKSIAQELSRRTLIINEKFVYLAIDKKDIERHHYNNVILFLEKGIRPIQNKFRNRRRQLNFQKYRETLKIWRDSQGKLNNNCVLSLESLKSDRQFIVLAGEDKGKHLMIIAWDLAEFQKYELELPKIKFQTTFAINKQESIKLIPDFTEFIDEELKFNLNNLTAILRIVSEQYQDKRQQIYQQ